MQIADKYGFLKFPLGALWFTEAASKERQIFI
jgi:hypothetical protein